VTESCFLPQFDIRQATEIARRLFALDGSIKQLDGERDLNYLITSRQGKFVFKIANANEAPQMLECQHRVFQNLASARVFPQVATALESVHGKFIETVSSDQGSQHLCRVLPYIEGRLLSAAKPPGDDLLEDLGKCLAALDRALECFSSIALERPILWNMCDALPTLKAFKPLLADTQRRQLIEYFEAGFRRRVLPRQAELRRSVIHNDANDNNVLVDNNARRVVSIIDFGDMVNSWLAAEPAVAASYAMLGSPSPLRVACAILRGYHKTLALQDVEISLMFDLICMRLCISVCVCAHQRSLQPDNEYLSVSEIPAWALLGELAQLDYQTAHRQIRDSCEV
jgi:Ser/Thr protein kinase RdoA (MazF antagonist)